MSIHEVAKITGRKLSNNMRQFLTLPPALSKAFKVILLCLEAYITPMLADDYHLYCSKIN